MKKGLDSSSGGGGNGDERVKRALIVARNTIRKKFRDLHNQRLNFDYHMKEEFKPISDPLEKLVTESTKNVKKEEEIPLKKEFKDENAATSLISGHKSERKKKHKPSAVKKHFEEGVSDESSEEEYTTPRSWLSTKKSQTSRIKHLMQHKNSPHIYFDDDVSDEPSERPNVSPIARLNIEKSETSRIKQLLQHKTSANIDFNYGFNLNEDNELFIGNDPVKIKGSRNNLVYVVKGKEYLATEGLKSLLLHKDPKNYNHEDLKTYKELLEHTSAHKHNYEQNSGVKKLTGTRKYDHLIRGLFSKKEGKGVNLSTDRFDPNELVNRLRVLIASKSVGYKKEVASIVKQLRKAKVIK